MWTVWRSKAETESEVQPWGEEFRRNQEKTGRRGSKENNYGVEEEMLLNI